MKLVGYADAWTVRPGDKVGLHVSSRAAQYEVALLRMRHGDDNPAGPGFLATAVESDVAGRYQGAWYDVESGSCAWVEDAGPLLNSDEFTVACWVYPTKPGPETQAIITRGSFALELDGEGRPVARLGGVEVTGPDALVRRQWYLLVARASRSRGVLELIAQPREIWPTGPQPMRSASNGDPSGAVAGPLVMAARAEGQGRSAHFNGKIDAPAIFSHWLSDAEIEAIASDDACPPAQARWNFAGDQATLEIPSECGTWIARLVGMPARAATGHRAAGDVLDPSALPEAYSAIHFHEDDKHDAGWPTALTLTIPADWASGIYAFHLTTEDGEEDHVPFFVLPGRDAVKRDIAFLVPTFSYLAYGNAHFSHTASKGLPADAGILESFPPPKPHNFYIWEQRLNSNYDEHSDGSGVAYMSRLLPQVHVRPKQRASNGTPHQFNADLHLIDWLHAKDFAHDILTDEALHDEGLALLQPYRVILTGTHPEYWSGQMLDSLETYLRQGGRVLYMGGNGFYWVTSVHPNAPHVVEVRKYGGTRTWTAEVDERHHSTTGEMGGIWRDRGRAPNRVVGIGFAGQGYVSSGVYKRTEASYNGPLAKLFDGIEGDVFGDIPSLDWGRGIAGFELDRIDYRLGSPPSTVCLASSFNHGEFYQLVYEEALAFMTPAQLTDVNPDMRSDISYLAYPEGGAVFSTGSITFCGALSHNGYDNDASRLIENVVRHFLE